MTDINAAARERAVDKIRKLLAVARDGRGNEHEAARAAAQAERMMRHYQIESADEILEEIQSAEAFDQGLESVGFEPSGYSPKNVPSWVGIVAIGVGRAFTVKVDVVGTPDGVRCRFSGYAPDVELARWVYRLLCETVFRLSRERCQGSGTGGAAAFRHGAAGALQSRLYAMAAERDQENASAGGTAVVLYDRKRERVEEMFGAQTTQAKKSNHRDREAYHAGRAEGARINIPHGRPVAGGPKRRAIGA